MSATLARPPFPARLARLPVPVTVRLAEKRVPLATIRNLVPGALLSFDKDCGAPLDLYVANRKHAIGEAVKVGEHFGLKVTVVRGE
ncbi:FliM/FliN family flagellar motor switch protein [Alienimonas chondri]|uniref:Flagellar motor switch protein FliN-like C-terminal domain-containing protein n=1 Tax=Alienimonas chondri TaxID=2681879 RepID=A0ABX1VEM5_9PLAN|nr:FliM/FliN family flagellar motor C-terminal domain-containing protein [Alienimonas chondri]NNJ26519.1 hypothetical protein [Alienimonas chondri]